MSATASGARELAMMRRSERMNRLFGFEPVDDQALWLDAPGHEVVIVCGRQVGKTETASLYPLDWCLTHTHEDAAVFARFQETADELLRRTKDHIDASPYTEDQLGITTNNTQTIEWDNGCRIMSRTLGNDAKQQRGKSPSCIVIEEAALVTQEVYDRVIRPMFATHDEYLLVMISTTRGKSGPFWNAWNDDDFARFRTTTPESSLVTEAWIEKEREKVDSITWRQEYLGQFVDEGEVYIERRVVEDAVGDITEPERADSKWLGVDVARSGKDRTVYIGVDEKADVFLVESEDTSRIDGIVGRIMALDEEWAFNQILIDENAVGGGVVDFSEYQLGHRVTPVTFSLQSKQAMYKTFKRLLENGSLTIPNHDRLIEETSNLEFSYTPTGILKVHHRPGGHDDFPDATALAVWGGFGGEWERSGSGTW